MVTASTSTAVSAPPIMLSTVLVTLSSLISPGRSLIAWSTLVAASLLSSQPPTTGRS